MKDWPSMRSDAEAEIERANDLLHKADALLNRHRGGDEGGDIPVLTEVVEEFDIDIPILTDVAEGSGAATTGKPAAPAEAVLARAHPAAAEPAFETLIEPLFDASPAPPAASPGTSFFTPHPAPQPLKPPRAPQDHARVAEQLVQLETEIRREVEGWLATELPQILARELDALADKILVETLAQLRSTLLPAISERIAHRLDHPGE